MNSGIVSGTGVMPSYPLFCKGFPDVSTELSSKMLMHHILSTSLKLVLVDDVTIILVTLSIRMVIEKVERQTRYQHR